MKKIIFINFIIFFILFISIEFFFGNWFSKNNFGIHMKHHTNVKVKYQTEINGVKKEYIFKRNSLGFRNEEFNASDIELVFVGGSTTIQRHLEKKDTIVGILNKKFKGKYTFANAGIAGKSSYGYLCDFKYWFNKLENLKPKYYIFYTGLNDGYDNKNKSLTNSNFLKCEGITSRSKVHQKIRDYFFNSSFFISSTRKIINEKKKYMGNLNFEWSSKKQMSYYGSNIAFSEIDKFYKNLNSYYCCGNAKLEKNLENYKNNLENLKKIFLEKQIDPIFITQTTSHGLHEKLYRVNQITKDFSKRNNYKIILLDEDLSLNENDFYDGIHTNEIGSKKIADYIYDKLSLILIE